MKLPDLTKITKIDKVGVHERVNRFCKRSIKISAKEMGLHLALSMIDLTTLEGKDTPEKVKQLCYKAQVFTRFYSGAAQCCCCFVCIQPWWGLPKKS